MMTRFLSAGKIVPLCLGALLLLTPGSYGQAQQAAAPPAAAAADDATPAPLTEDELEVLVARIALYPDDLVALVISASLYPLQIVQAERFLEQKKTQADLAPNDKWDGSIVSLLNYPQVVKMMSDDLDWTEQLGNAAAYQQKDLLVAIQQLRDQAVDKGILSSNDKVNVQNQGDTVIIQSTDPQTVYVPTYPPEMLYEPGYVATPIVYDSYPSYFYPTAPFWAGVVTGAFWGAVVDWDDWGCWGGDVDIDVDIGDRVDFDFDKIDIDKIDIDKIRNLDLKNIDRSKIDMKNMNFDRNKLKDNLKSKDFNNVADRARNREGSDIGKMRDQVRAGDIKGKDVRKNVADGLKNKPGAKLPAPGNRQADGKRLNDNVKTARPNVQKNKAQQVSQKRTGPKKTAAKRDNRPNKPSAMGNPRPGRVTTNHSNRGQISRGGGSRGGQIHRGGGNRGGGMHRGGGGRGGRR